MSQLTIEYLTTVLDLEMTNASLGDSFVYNCKFARFTDRKEDEEMWITDYRVQNLDNDKENDPRGHDLKQDGMLYLWHVHKEPETGMKKVWTCYMSSEIDIEDFVEELNYMFDEMKIDRIRLKGL